MRLYCVQDNSKWGDGVVTQDCRLLPFGKRSDRKLKLVEATARSVF